MLTKDYKLIVFEDFRVDHKLPKYARPSSVYQESDESSDESKFSNGVNVSFEDNLVFSNFTRNTVESTARSSWISGWFKYLYHLFKPKKREPKPTISITEFFTSVKNSTQELEIVRERAAGYERAMTQAKNGGQTALLEKLQKGIEINRNEGQLVAIESRKYITEEDVVRFVKEAKKGLRLDWVCNFTRIIPPKVIELKVRMDSLGIFDNYVVLHYDPNKKSWAETQAEIAARKDPILFGVMSGSRKLYFVGDWVDDFCDLTLEQIADQLGSSTVRELDP
jgi:hypothetical protein